MKTIKIQSGIYWLASYPRSGNTWVRMFLRAFMHGSCDINKQDTIVDGIHAVAPWEIAARKPAEEIGFDERPALLKKAYIEHLKIAKGQDVRLKIHDSNCSVEDFNTVPDDLTKGGAYLVRDPRDVAVSYAKYKDCSIDEAIQAMGRWMITGRKDCYAWEAQGSWSWHVKSWTGTDPPPRVAAFKYEDMQAHSEECFYYIALAMGMPYLEECEFEQERIKLYEKTGDMTVLRGRPRVSAALKQVEFAKLKKQEERDGFQESEHKSDAFFRSGKVGGWKDVLTDEQVAKIEEDHGEVMNILGYELRGENATTKQAVGTESA